MHAEERREATFLFTFKIPPEDGRGGWVPVTPAPSRLGQGHYKVEASLGHFSAQWAQSPTSHSILCVVT